LCGDDRLHLLDGGRWHFDWFSVIGLNEAGHDEGKRDKSCHADHDQPLGSQDLLTHRRSHGDSFLERWFGTRLFDGDITKPSISNHRYEVRAGIGPAKGKF
jgi:hypothetical protein